ncbi:MAG TPA: TIM barrel protein [Abditibacteriaceae bacterium]
MAFKQGVCYWPLGELSPTQWKEIWAIGLTGIEMPPAERYADFRDMGYSIVSINGHQSIEDGLNRRENHARIVDELRASLQVAKEFEIQNLICFAGNRNGQGDEEGAANTIEGLSLLAKEAEAAGVTLILELLNSKVDHPDYQCDHTAWGAKVVGEVNSPRVKLLYDIYHMQIMEGDLIRNIRDNIAHIGHFHTAGNPGRKDLDDAQEINYAAVARAIYETGYSGWLGHEFHPKGDVVAALRQAFELCAVV